MAKIKIAVAGCLGRMGQELTKQILDNKQLEFVGGFEHKKHKHINKQLIRFFSATQVPVLTNFRSGSTELTWPRRITR